MQSERFLSRLLCTAAVLVCAFGGFAEPASAQRRSRPAPSVSRPVVQPLPSADGLKLNAALSRLGRNPRDLDALIDAGNAALAMGDVDAAGGFFKRADQVSSKDPRVKAGLGAALVRSGDPLSAIALFDQAEKAGAQASTFAADRGLAYDLVGDNGTAQRLYRLALARGADPEVTRRLALSQAIAGDQKGSEATLLPLLRQQDKAAWRTRTFALAILSETDDAIRTAKTILPGTLAESMTPYLRYMPQLTRAQQAAAANLGDFPRASEIGRDGPRLAQYAATSVRSPAVAADAALVPKGEPLGSSARAKQERSRRESSERRSRRSSRSARVAPSVPHPSRESAVEPATAAALAATPNPSASMSAPVRPSASPQVPQLAAAASAPAARQAARSTTTRPASPAAQPGFDLSRVPQARSPASAPQAPTERISLKEIFKDIGAPSTAAVAAAGAVDISNIVPAKPKPAPAKAAPAKPAPPKPAPPSHPSRIWVQLGIGRDKDALAIDWKRLSAKPQFKGQKAYVSEMGQTNRMLTGPFDSTAQASKFVNELHAAGVEGPYVWTSPAGQVVDALPIG